MGSKYYKLRKRKKKLHLFLKVYISNVPKILNIGYVQIERTLTEIFKTRVVKNKMLTDEGC